MTSTTILATPLTAQQQTADVNAAVANEIAFVNHLVGDGAKNLLVLDVPDLGKIPEITQGLTTAAIPHRRIRCPGVAACQ